VQLGDGAVQAEHDGFGELASATPDLIEIDASRAGVGLDGVEATDVVKGDRRRVRRRRRSR
jgi:hypothetical protein